MHLSASLAVLFFTILSWQQVAVQGTPVCTRSLSRRGGCFSKTSTTHIANQLANGPVYPASNPHQYPPRPAGPPVQHQGIGAIGAHLAGGSTSHPAYAGGSNDRTQKTRKVGGTTGTSAHLAGGRGW